MKDVRRGPSAAPTVNKDYVYSTAPLLYNTEQHEKTKQHIQLALFGEGRNLARGRVLLF
jgi:hypothetical protein